MKVNAATVTHLFGAEAKAVLRLEKDAGRSFYQHRGNEYAIIVSDDGQKVLYSEPTPTPRISRVSVVYLKAGIAISDDNTPRNVAFVYSVPIKMLCGSSRKFYMYNVSFATRSAKEIPSESADVLSVGYYGITGRHPLKRFVEHYRDAARGAGHLLHKTWHHLMHSGCQVEAHVRLAGYADTLDDIYSAEETAVETSISPKGLNVVPGGHAGIKFLHNLRLLDRAVGVSPDKRDDALRALEVDKRVTHYRSGHFRTLPTGKETWIRPCWVNPSPEFEKVAA
ncbi:hypothetical protein NKJ23_15850 [Mesorhizobium sp. M0184]|uniref:hypothetical protein n=1 Tax=Mesorhizobium sp. M0184 TaxID=2956906 RepID=UPI003339F789